MVARRGVADTEETLPDVALSNGWQATTATSCLSGRETAAGLQPPPDEEEVQAARVSRHQQKEVLKRCSRPQHLKEDVAEGEHKEPAMQGGQE